jgi:hypothetical protein
LVTGKLVSRIGPTYVFSLPPHQVLNNFEGLDLGIMDKIYDFGLASYIDGRVRKKKERQEEGKKRIRRLFG